MTFKEKYNFKWNFKIKNDERAHTYTEIYRPIRKYETRLNYHFRTIFALPIK